MWIIVSGDIIEGFDFIGTFETEDDAIKYAKELDHKDWIIAHLLPPLA